ncbi:3'-5' exoribonuclease [Mycolicibacillus parakoreensis]|uniref:Exonuclease domain-containing protein n=1 Tax=Mycolicibacillus parakoreensis TaxID=1069221 RepID=A0ABY3U1B3_9MYCO|nr:exonuclease domain-containing protein [Mycolicibacillus parakoreensis]MCV7315907.1 3'-5' exoribonuclease [Mycolicibacillus parakoreensis]ULN52461.1 exonuclease domain-containing protein [Mycolicibacillus parakoreensis]
MLNYTAIDFETANSRRGSPCSVGLVRVRGGVAVEEIHWLMRPPEGLDYFQPYNVRIHGITADMVDDQPRWVDRLPGILNFIGDDVVVAHNASFDTSVIRGACDADGLPWPHLDYLCTMVLARRALQLPSYRLAFVLRALGKTITDHHNALADALAVTDVVRGLSTLQKVADLQELALRLGVSPGRIRQMRYTGCISNGRVRRTHTPQPASHTAPDPGNPLYGRVVVFTGALHSMSRKTAEAECQRIGATVRHSVTKRTNVVVLGDINPAVLTPGARLPRKAETALALQASGQSNDQNLWMSLGMGA